MITIQMMFVIVSFLGGTGVPIFPSRLDLALNAQVETKASETDVSSAEKQLTSGTGTWVRSGVLVTNSAEKPVIRYIFKADHKVDVEKAGGGKSTEEWRVTNYGGDTHVQIGENVYLLYFNTEGATPKIRLGILANEKADPSSFIEYKLAKSSQRDYY